MKHKYLISLKHGTFLGHTTRASAIPPPTCRALLHALSAEELCGALSFKRPGFFTVTEFFSPFWISSWKRPSQLIRSHESCDAIANSNSTRYSGCTGSYLHSHQTLKSAHPEMNTALSILLIAVWVTALSAFELISRQTAIGRLNLSMKGKGNRVPVNQRGEFMKQQRMMQQREQLENAKVEGKPNSCCRYC